MSEDRLAALRIKAAARPDATPATTQVIVDIIAAEPLTAADRALLTETVTSALAVAGAALLLRGHRGLIAHDVRVAAPLKGVRT